MAPPPRMGYVFQVRYVDEKGQTFSKMYIRRSDADAFKDWVNRCGGHANVWGSDTSWAVMG